MRRWRPTGGLQRVATVAGLVKWLEKLPDEAIVYHASNHHFSKWLRARSELQARAPCAKVHNAKVHRRAVQCSAVVEPRRAALHCTALHCTALHCTPLHCIVNRSALVRILC